MKRKILAYMFVIVISSIGWTADASTFDTVMEHYEPIRLALLEDSMEGVNEHGRAIANELRSLRARFSEEGTGATGEAVDVVREKLGEMIASAEAIASADDLATARDAIYELSKPMVRWREGVPSDDRPNVAYCPMYKRSWLQPGQEIGNPYGNMPRCGEIVSK